MKTRTLKSLLAGLGLAATVVQAGAASSTINYSGFTGFSQIRYDSTFSAANSVVNRPTTGGAPAYDYASFMVRTGEDTGARHRHFWCGRWLSPWSDGDHILQNTSPDGGAGNWAMWYNDADIWPGYAQGGSGYWWQGNVCDPEVIWNPPTGEWICYTQYQINPGDPLDYGGYAITAGDRIGYHTSPNLIRPWWRAIARGIFVNIPDPARTFFHHHQVIYVTGDPQPYWIYVGINVNNVFEGYFRIKSADPTTFDFGARQPAGLAQLGNQLGYLDECPGGRLFYNITFVDNGAGRTVPSIQISRDGLNFSWGDNGPVLMDGSHDNYANKNCYFLGLGTLPGGATYYLGAGHWKVVYSATTANSPVTPEMWSSEIGRGDLDIYIGGNSASVVSKSFPSTVTTGSSFSATITMNNNGATHWVNSNGYNLGSQNPENNTRWGLSRVGFAGTISPGQNYAFTFNCTAPTTAGSYAFDWKMVQDGVEWFGATATGGIQVNAPSTGVIVDNPQATYTGSWTIGSSATDKYGADYRYHTTATVNEPATFTANITAGAKNTYAWWPQGPNRSKKAPYIITHSGGSTTVNKNQQASGGSWQSLGNYTFNAGNNTIKLSCWTTTGYIVVADAVKFGD
jgi:hypothetical protein